MNVEQIEQRFRELKEQKEAGKINDEQFAAEAEKLQFQDGQGRLWGIDVSTDQWYYKEEGRWVRGEPPRKPAPVKKPPVKPPSSPFSKSLFLVVAAFIVIVLIIGYILASLALISEPATPTAVVLVTKTATPSPTVILAQMPTDTPSSTVPPTPGPTDTPSPILTATTTFTPIPTNTPPPAPTNSATLTPTPMSEPPPPPPTIAGKIAFPVFDPKRGTYDIFIVNADGTGRQKIKEEASQPCLSPDGTQIAYRSWRSDKRGLFMADTSSGNDRWTITTLSEASRPSVSGGGIAYYLRQSLDSPACMYLFSGSEEPRVIRWGGQPLPGESPVWVSGERLAYKGCIRGACGLYLTQGVNDGTGITQITDNTSDTNPDASPDGKKVAFMSRRDMNWEIYVLDLDSYIVKRLTANAANDGLPIWSPDGRTIAFASDRSGEWAIWAMDPDGSNQRLLFPLGGSLHGYAFNAPLNERGGWEEERLSWSP